MPSNQTPLGALPARFRRQRVLIVGCGDVGLRTVPLLQARVRVLALTSNPQRVAELRGRGVVPLLGNLDEPATLRRLAGVAQGVLHLAPPGVGSRQSVDWRTRSLLQALARRAPPQTLVYVSTTGVYGDCQGQWVNETHATNPITARACARVDAERHVRQFGRALGTRAAIVRAPGIYAADRPSGNPVQRLRDGVAVLARDDDVFANHIHADDLVRAVVRALWLAKPGRVFHANDHSDWRAGDAYDRLAAHVGLPAPQRLTRTQAAQQWSPERMSFLNESRRLDNRRILRELRLSWRYPTWLDCDWRAAD